MRQRPRTASLNTARYIIGLRRVRGGMAFVNKVGGLRGTAPVYRSADLHRSVEALAVIRVARVTTVAGAHRRKRLARSVCHETGREQERKRRHNSK